MVPIFIVAAALLAIFAMGVGMYNRLVALRERFRNAFAQIDVQLKRRYDLIPNLVETAKGYMAHERETLEAVIHARNQAVSAERVAAANPGSPSAMAGLQGAEQLLGGLLTQFFALAENYPDLKASTNMLGLQEELSSTENRIAFARQAYNDSVMQYNQTRASVPTNLVATAFRFDAADFFELEVTAERETPNVSFG
jgi:LemA protein